MAQISILGEMEDGESIAMKRVVRKQRWEDKKKGLYIIFCDERELECPILEVLPGMLPARFISPPGVKLMFAHLN